MAGSLRRQALLALALAAAGHGHPAGAAEFQCSRGDLMRRIAVSGPDGIGGVACEVRYWRDARAPGSGQSLWRANQDAEFCAARARELIARLEAGGWTCGSSGQPARAEPVQAADAHPEGSPGGEIPLPTRAAAPAPAPTVPPLESAAPDLASQPSSPADAGAAPPAEPVSPALARVGPPASSAEPTSRVAAPAAPAAPSEETASSDSPNVALLNRVVGQTLHSVQELYGGQSQAEPAAFGDLDGDGLEDAAVVITYQTDQKEYVQYLVAYLFNGQTFQSAATRNVGGRFLDAVRADLQGIADGRILIELEAPDESGSCCARRRTAFALAKGQLIEVGDPGAANLEPAGQAAQPSPS